MSDFYSLDEAGQALAMQELAEAALPLWSLQGSKMRLIKYRENAVFEVNTLAGERYALRIHRYAYHSDAALQSELQWMAALADSGVDVPELLHSDKGKLFEQVQTKAVPEQRQVDVFAWINGAPMGDFESGQVSGGDIATQYSTIGRLAARLHNQASEWLLPQGFDRHAWDVEGLVGEQPFWGPFWQLEALTAEQRSLLLDARERVRKDMLAYAGRDDSASCYSLIHADFVRENLMLDGDTVRLIDFDDAGFGWHLFELATAVYFEMDEPHYEECLAALIAGYRKHRPLSDEQLQFLPLFLLARSFTYLGWVHTRAETQTARELTPVLVEKCCALARDYLTA